MRKPFNIRRPLDTCATCMPNMTGCNAILFLIIPVIEISTLHHQACNILFNLLRCRHAATLWTVTAFKSTYKSSLHAGKQCSLTDWSDNESARTHHMPNYWGHAKLQHQQKKRVHSMHVRHAVLVGLQYRITMQVYRTNCSVEFCTKSPVFAPAKQDWCREKRW